MLEALPPDVTHGMFRVLIVAATSAPLSTTAEEHQKSNGLSALILMTVQPKADPPKAVTGADLTVQYRTPSLLGRFHSRKKWNFRSRVRLSIQVFDESRLLNFLQQ